MSDVSTKLDALLAALSNPPTIVADPEAAAEAAESVELGSNMAAYAGTHLPARTQTEVKNLLASDEMKAFRQQIAMGTKVEAELVGWFLDALSQILTKAGWLVLA